MGVGARRRARARVLVARVALDVTPLRSSPPFRRLWTGQAVAYLGWRMLQVAIPVQVYGLTGSTLDVGLVALTQFVPLVTLTIVGGAVADAVDRRRLLLVSSGGVVVALAGFVANALVAHPRVWLVFVCSGAAWSAFAVGAGAGRSLTARLVPPEQLPSASALTGLYNNLGSVAGPAVAGILIQQIGLGATYAISLTGALAAVATAATLPALPPIGDAVRVTLGSLADGFRYLGVQRVVLGFFLIDTIAMIFGMPMALFPALAQHVFGDPAAVGYLFAAPAVGAVVASLVSGWARHVGRQGIAIVVAASAWGVAIAGFGLARTLWLAVLLLALAGAADQISAIFRSTIVLTVTPDNLRGRLGGIEFAQVASTPALGNLEAGAVASLTSLRFSVVSGGVACVVGTVLLALAFPQLLGYDARGGPR